MTRPGLYLVHKPAGPTSHSVVRQFMREGLKVCHGGTLDPFAEGLLLILAGAATRLFEHLHAAPKTYVAAVSWGVETDTGDAGGKVVSRGDAAPPSEWARTEALRSFHGWTQQVPPATSAKKVRGEPAYRKAHRGEPVELPASRVYLHAARWLGESELELTCRGGFYVRALVRDLGRQLGPGAHLTGLRRTAIGPWSDPSGEPIHVRGRAMLPWATSRELSREEVLALRRASIPATSLLPAPWAMPDGFPDPQAPVLGLRNDGVLALLRREKEGLALLDRFPNAV